MEPEFWHQKWAANQLGFHEGETNALLKSHFGALSLANGARIFLPLCGKTRDIAWLLSKGCGVVGAELSEIAIEQLFMELGLKPEISATGNVKHYSAQDIDIFVGDIFAVSRAMLGPIDAVYDRAALVALPEAMRSQYTAHLTDITKSAPQLLLSIEYDQTVMAGPPFSISSAEVSRHYEGTYTLTFIECLDIPGGLKGRCPATESAWLLKN